MAGRPIIIFHSDGAVSALDASEISAGREIGSTGAFDRCVGERVLHFDYLDGRFVDRETGSVWTIAGRAADGPLHGERLEPVEHGNYFSFAWFAFRPETRVYTESAAELDHE